MTRPTPFFIFGSTAVVIILMLGLLNTVSPSPVIVQAAAIMGGSQAGGGAPEIYVGPISAPETAVEEQPAAPAQQAAQPELAQSVPAVEPVFDTAAAPDGSLAAFIQQVADGSSGLTGVYASGQFAFPVVRQPAGDPVWVSTGDQDVTLFDAPLEHGVTALLAHNNLAGRTFAGLPDGQEIILVYGDGSTQPYRISGRESYESIEPLNTVGDLVNLDSGARLTSGQVFERLYTGRHALVLQTCIERNGDYFWGRLFLLAEPAG